jgi:hypothetical protein
MSWRSNRHALARTAILVLSSVCGTSIAVAQLSHTAEAVHRRGWLLAVYGAGTEYSLATDDGETWRLEIEPGPQEALATLVGRRVGVGGLRLPTADPALTPALRVFSLGPVVAVDGRVVQEASASASLTGVQRWISIGCKFSDVADEPHPPAYFAEMYDAVIDPFWRELSYGRVSVAGSFAGWFTLPHPRSAYFYADASGQQFDTWAFGRDCVIAADAAVDFAPIDGINLMINGATEGPPWGGFGPMPLDGTPRWIGLTWIPPAAQAHAEKVLHEMGHAFGLNHSSGAYGQVYDNPWDIMSGGSCGPRHARYGCIGNHTIAYQKDQRGWLPGASTVRVDAADLPFDVVLERIAQPVGEGALLLVVQTAVNRFLTMEARRRVGYDAGVPGEGVIVHEVVPGRPGGTPIQVVDLDLNGNVGDAGAVWTLDEVFIGGGLSQAPGSPAEGERLYDNTRVHSRVTPQ